MICILPFLLSSCIGQALNVARSPGAVADAVAANSARSIVGDDLSTLFSDSDAARSIDQALIENPDAVNGEELRHLRDEIEAHDLSSGNNRSSPVLRADRFDRRQRPQQRGYSSRVDPQTGLIYDSSEIGVLNAPRVPLEQPLPQDRLLRSRDEWRFGLQEHSNIRRHKVHDVRYHEAFKPKIIEGDQLKVPKIKQASAVNGAD